MRQADSTDNYFVGAQSINTGSFDEILGTDDILVSQDTTYFVVDQYDAAQSEDTQEIFWYGSGTTANTTGLAGSVALTASGGGWTTRTDDYQQMTVSGISPAPEPGTFVIAGMCLIGLALGGRYKRSQGRL